MTRRKEVSVRLIARECGVSTATVSRVLNNPELVAEGTRNKVLDALRFYGYSFPAADANEAVPQKIGILITATISAYYTNLVQHVSDHFMERGIPVIISNTEGQDNYLPTALEALYSSDVSGIVLISCDYHAIKDRLKPEIPAVWIDCNDDPEEILDLPQVQSDHYVSGQLAAQELLNKGCSRPIILTSSIVTHRALDRISGFRSMLKKNGIEMSKQQIYYLPYIKHHFIESRDMIQYLITKGESFDSIFAINDWRSLGALIGVQSCGLRVPEDIRIIGFDGISIVCNMVMNITSIQQNTRLLARNACTILEKLMKGEKCEETRIIVPPHLVAGQTT